MPVKPMAVLALPVFALLAALAAQPASSATAGGPTSGAAPPPAVQQKAPPAPGPEQKDQAPQTPVSVPVPEIAQRAEEVAGLLRELEALAAPGPAIEAMQAGLPDVSARLGQELDSTIGTLKQDPALTTLDGLTQSWQASRAASARWQEALTVRATQLEEGLARLAILRASWTQTRVDARASRAPAAVVQRVDTILAGMEAVRAQLQVQRSAILALQDRVAEEVARCEDALARIDRFRQGALGQLFARDTSPIWSPESRARPLGELPARVGDAVAARRAQLRQFMGDAAARLLLHGVLFIALVLLARTARRRMRGPAAAGEGALPATAVFDRPYAVAVVATVAASYVLYPQPPRVVWDLLAVLVLVPALRIVQPMVGPAVAPAAYGLVAFGLVDRVRSELAVVPLADQALLLLEMLAAMSALAWLFGSGRLRAPRVAVGFALGTCAVSFAAGAYGNVSLARLLGSGLIGSAFLALMLSAVLQVANGLVTFALRTWPLLRLGMVQRHRALLERRAFRLLRWITAGTWAAATLGYLGLLNSAAAFGQAVLGAELRRGSLNVSVADVLVFVLTVWAAFLLSALLRFVLEEDVYPNLRLPRGLPSFLSGLLHYAVLLAGFLLALAALGADLTQITILAGAFGVGIGFGLQNVVNNFVSGVLVIFERRIDVGDAVQIGDVEGRVQQMGMRACTVRTWEGAEVIVPNASLVSNNVTNWTLSDRLRRIDVAVGVAYGSAPEQVLELLRGVAASHPGVLAEPAPLALFLGFAESALSFELRAWTDRFDQWVVIRSELGVAVYAALREAGMEIPFPQREVRFRQG